MWPLHEVDVRERLHHAARESHALNEPEDIDPDRFGPNQLSKHYGDQARCSPGGYDHPWPDRHYQSRDLCGAENESPRRPLVGIREDVEAAGRDVGRSPLVRARKLDFQPVECVK